MVTEAERLSSLETALRYIREGQEQAAETAHDERKAMRDEIAAMREDLQKVKDVLTKASGVKLAFMMFGAGLAFLVSQLWQFLNFSK